MRKRLTALVLAVLALTVLTALTPPAARANETWYVYTADGKTLNVRSVPNGPAIGKLKFGAAVDVIRYSVNGWSAIWFAPAGTSIPQEAYVQSRFLVRSMPTPGGGGASGGSIAAMNAEFRSARAIGYPYTVVARPTRASGWVNLRWAPSLDAERISTCTDGKELTVLVEMNNWFQVRDPVTGMIGFVDRRFVTAR